MAGETPGFEETVCQIGSPDAQTQLTAIQRLVSLDDPRAIDHLLPILRAVGSIDNRVFRAACEALEHLAHTHLDALIEAVKNEKHHIALSRLVEIAGRTRDPRIVEPLFHVDRGLFLYRDVMGRDEDFVADEINSALRQVGPPAVDFLIRMLRDPDPTVRHRAARDLTIMKDPRAIAPLLERLQDPYEDVRRAAIFAFRLVWDDRVVDPLIALVRDPSPYVREEVVCALGRIGDPRAFEPLIKALRDRNAWIRGKVVGALRGIGDPRAVESLIPMLRDHDRGVRTSTISVLGQFNDERAVEPLIRMVRDRDYGVRSWAVGTLGIFARDSRVVAPLINALRDPVDTVRNEAVMVLRREFDTPEVQAALRAFERGEIKPLPKWRFWLRLW